MVIPPYETITLMLGAANRDPAQYADPDTLDVTRANVRPLSFRGGIHHCLGAQLARLEMELVFTALVERMPTFELPEKDNPACVRTSPFAASPNSPPSGIRARHLPDGRRQ